MDTMSGSCSTTLLRETMKRSERTSVTVNGIAATVNLNLGTATLSRGDVKWSGEGG